PTLTLEDLRKRSPDGVARASGVFARAWQHMFGRARATADAEAQAGVATALSEIAEADGVIAEAARHLPEKTRALVAGIR
ncbi:hypothetical protein, partial [Loktanella sp. SALINAS62]|uniref:hypothetical protein n=1 Tax=Loktanella sp. SALINAS62 TaxID=2706124 RepID=UPI001B8AC159